MALGRNGAKGVGCRCVSLDGDDFNPGGTVTGGRRRDPGRILEACFAAAAAESAVGQARQAVAAAKQRLADLTPAAQQHSKCAQFHTTQEDTGCRGLVEGFYLTDRIFYRDTSD